MADANATAIPARVKDLTGKVFGRLTVTSYAGGTKDSSRWRCQCECGAIRVVLRTNLMNGQTKSCGCLRRQVAAATHTTHGGRSTPEYKAWAALIRRCHNSNDDGYHRYGGRGICVCDRWRASFEAFLEDMGPRPSSRHSIERKENDLGYCKDNCVWATPSQQTRNRRSNVLITFDGRTMCLTDWAIEAGIRVDTLWARLNRFRWPIERALKPVHVTSPIRQESASLSETP